MSNHTSSVLKGAPLDTSRKRRFLANESNQPTKRCKKELDTIIDELPLKKRVKSKPIYDDSIYDESEFDDCLPINETFGSFHCEDCGKEFNLERLVRTHQKRCVKHRQARGLSPLKNRKRTWTEGDTDETEWSDFDDEKENVRIDTKNWKRIYKKILESSSVSVQVLRDYKVGDTVYGEALPNLVRFLIKKLNLKSTDVFYDIGSGIGNVVFQVAAQTGCRCIGLEIREDLHDLAESIKTIYDKEMRSINVDHGEIQLIRGDALDEDNDYLLTDCTVAFMNNVCYTPDLDQGLLRKYLTCLKHGTRVVAIKDLFPRVVPTQNPERWKGHPVSIFEYPWETGTISGKQKAVSWTSAAINYHIYRVNRKNGKDETCEPQLEPEIADIGLVKDELNYWNAVKVRTWGASTRGMAHSCFKAALVELCRAHSKPPPLFESFPTGPPHQPLFIVAVHAWDTSHSSSEHQKKRLAEEEAAKIAFDAITTKLAEMKIAPSPAEPAAKINFKGKLQEICCKLSLAIPTYHSEQITIENCHHTRTTAVFRDQTFTSTQASKAKAEADVARQILESLKTEPVPPKPEVALPTKNLLTSKLTRLKKDSLLMAGTSTDQKYEVLEQAPWQVSLKLPFLPASKTFYSGPAAKKKDAEEDCAIQALDFIQSILDPSHIPNLRPEYTPKSDEKPETADEGKENKKNEVKAEPCSTKAGAIVLVDDNDWLITSPEYGQEPLFCFDSVGGILRKAK